MNIINKYTFRCMKRSKSRTIITLVGIVLAATMLTAVAVFFSSLDNYLIKAAVSASGSQQATVYDVDGATAKEILDKPEIKSFSVIQQNGSGFLIDQAAIANSQQKPKDHIFKLQMESEEQTADFVEPVILLYGCSSEYLTENLVLAAGAYPTSATEIVLPTEIATLDGIKYKIGDEIPLAVGSDFVRDDGTTVSTKNTDDILADPPTGMVVKHQTAYKIVGFYDYQDNYKNVAGGYNPIVPQYLQLSGITGMAEENPSAVTITLSITKPADIFSFLAPYTATYDGTGAGENGATVYYNYGLLSAQNALDKDNPDMPEDGLMYLSERSFNILIFQLLQLLIIGVVMIGAFSLINNAFSISISQRTKELGLLASVGAGRRLILQSLLFEAVTLSLVAIPVGIGVGIGLVAILLRVASSAVGTLLDKVGSFDVTVSWQSLAIAVGFSLLTIFLSVYIPAVRMLRLTIMESLRQNSDIHLSAKKVKAGQWAYKLFKFPGLAAAKNYKRNRKQYRATVLSLFMCIVLFILGQSMSLYLHATIAADYGFQNYDLENRQDWKTSTPSSYKELSNGFSNIDSITKQTAVTTIYLDCKVAPDQINPEYLEYSKEYLGDQDSAVKIDGEWALVSGALVLVDDQTFNELVAKNQHATTAVLGQTLLMDDSQSFSDFTGVQYKSHLFKDLGQSAVPIMVEKFILLNNVLAEEALNKDSDLSHLNIYDLPQKELTQPLQIDLTGRSTWSFSDMMDTNSGVRLLAPFSSCEAFLGYSIEEYFGYESSAFFFKASDVPAAESGIKAVLLEAGQLPEVMNYAEYIGQFLAAIKLIDIFSVAFIVMISLIAGANVFNTVSTNMKLRRREFAVLEAVGVDSRMLKRMNYLECVLYGVKALVYAIPVSLVFNYLLSRTFSFMQGNIGLLWPWKGTVICVVSVFFIIFAAMLYSRRKLNQENIIDILKQEEF